MSESMVGKKKPWVLPSPFGEENGRQLCERGWRGEKRLGDLSRRNFFPRAGKKEMREGKRRP